MDKIELYKYTTRDDIIYYDIPIYQEGDRYIYYGYDIKRKIWLGPYSVSANKWFGPETDPKPYTFDVIPNKSLRDLIMKLFKET